MKQCLKNMSSFFKRVFSCKCNKPKIRIRKTIKSRKPRKSKKMKGG
jgi:hypothetical protein